MIMKLRVFIMINLETLVQKISLSKGRLLINKFKRLKFKFMALLNNQKKKARVLNLMKNYLTILQLMLLENPLNHFQI